jgi:hypothetical protein
MLRLYPMVLYNAGQPIDFKSNFDLPALNMIASMFSVG